MWSWANRAGTRVRIPFGRALLAAVTAAAAWALAKTVLGQPQPLFAAVAPWPH